MKAGMKSEKLHGVLSRHQLKRCQENNLGMKIAATAERVFRNQSWCVNFDIEFISAVTV